MKERIPGKQLRERRIDLSGGSSALDAAWYINGGHSPKFHKARVLPRDILVARRYWIPRTVRV